MSIVLSFFLIRNYLLGDHGVVKLNPNSMPKGLCIVLIVVVLNIIVLLITVGIEPLNAWHYITNWDTFKNVFIHLCFLVFLYPICINWISKHTHSYLLHCTWLMCIRSCIEATSHGFLVSRYVIHNQFMDLGNLVKTVIILPPNWKDDLSWSSGWVSHGKCTNVCDAHWTRTIVNHDIRLSIVMIHQATILHGLSTLRRYWTCVIVNKRL